MPTCHTPPPPSAEKTMVRLGEWVTGHQSGRGGGAGLVEIIGGPAPTLANQKAVAWSG